MKGDSFIHPSIHQILIECVYYVPGIGDTTFSKIKDGYILREIITYCGDRQDKVNSEKNKVMFYIYVYIWQKMKVQ